MYDKKIKKMFPKRYMSDGIKRNDCFTHYLCTKPIEETDPDEISSETLSENRPGSTIVSYNGISISYNNLIVFNGKKKLNAESFGTITISYNGSYYTADKISVSKKKQSIIMIQQQIR